MEERALAVLDEAVGAAQAKYSEAEAKKQAEWKKKKNKRSKEKPPAVRTAKAYKCRKKVVGGVVLEEYMCTVSDWTVKKEHQEEGAAAAREPEEVRCARLQRWEAALAADPSEEKDAFWAAVAAENEALADLQKLGRHAMAGEDATGHGKVKEALEAKAKALYKKFARDQHPDKVPRSCATEAAKEVAQAVFDRAADWKECVMKPMRCSLPVPKSELDQWRETERFTPELQDPVESAEEAAAKKGGKGRAPPHGFGGFASGFDPSQFGGMPGMHPQQQPPQAKGKGKAQPKAKTSSKTSSKSSSKAKDSKPASKSSSKSKRSKTEL